MFNVIKHSGLGNICIVVTRYFGGIKLGTGGIARAYSSSVNLVLNDTDSELVHLTCRKTLSVPFHLTGMIEHQLKKFSRVYVIERVWFDKGLDLILELEEPSVADFLAALSPYQHELSIAALS
jgi:putative IMPACT (imprinted ancient) family translation regulator